MMLRARFFILALASLLLTSACEPDPGEQQGQPPQTSVSIERTGFLKADKLLEASGLQASHSREGDFFVHNDEGPPRIYAINEKGANLGHISILPAKNKDWEDLASVPVEDGRWLVAGDIGDNMARRKYIKLYFIEEPKPGKNDRYKGDSDLKHWLTLSYPDGPRDCEAMAYDPVGDRILLISKRDKPPRLYSIDLQTALTEQNVELTFLGTMLRLRRPTPADRAQFGGRTDFISQPTGFDISPDGNEAVVLTYRSIYHFRREAGEDWVSALQGKPLEVVGPTAPQNEGITYSTDGRAVYVTTEKIPAPVFRVQFLDGE